MTGIPQPAPEWQTQTWFNAPGPVTLASLRGRVVLLSAFQMLCPGCVSGSIPQLIEAHKLFNPRDVAVIGMHTVFEHHEAMTPACLKVFLHEYRIAFPVGVDQPGPEGDPMPVTMRRYAMRGTPTTILIDREGRIRRQMLGHLPDMQLGAEIVTLVAEGGHASVGAGEPSAGGAACRAG